MYKPFRYTINYTLYVNVTSYLPHPSLTVNSSIASQTPCDELTAADLCNFLRNADMHIKKKKETLQGLRKNMQSKMIFKDHIDRLSTDVRLNKKYDMVCGMIFFTRFYILDFLIQYNTSKNL